MMPGKPEQFSEKYASIFRDASVVSAYQFRPMYPPETFDRLVNLISPSAKPAIVLDAGCGTGFIARPLAPYVDHIDAVDISARMIAMAQSLPGGDHPAITWIAAPIETAPLSGPYALIVAAASLHWMDWDVTLPRFAHYLVPGGYLALVEDFHTPNPWDGPMTAILGRYSMNKDYTPYSMATLVAEFEARGLFQLLNQYETEPVLFQQPLEAYVKSYHARNGFSLDRMDPINAAQCDAQVTTLVEPYCENGMLNQWIRARILWGLPLSGNKSHPG